MPGRIIPRRSKPRGVSKGLIKRAAAKIAPRSKKSVSDGITKQKDTVLQLRQLLSRAPKPHQKASIQRRLDAESKKLADLIAGAKQKVQRAASPIPPGAKPVEAAAARAATSAVTSQLAQIESAIKKVKPLLKGQKGSTVVKHQAQTQTRLLNAQRARLHRRLTLLQKGMDLERPRKLSPGQVGKQRPRLGMPRIYEVPAPSDVSTTIRLIGAQVPRRSGEDATQYRHRIRAYTQRSLVRLANKKSVEKLATPVAIRTAVVETLQEDAPAIESEAQAGGIVVDPVAEMMDVAIDPVEGQLHAAVEDFAARPPSSPPSSEETDLLLLEADAAAAQVQEADIDDVAEAKGGKAFYEEPVVWAGALVLAGVLWAVSGRK